MASRTVVTEFHSNKMYAGRTGAWHAYFQGAKGTWEAGATAEEAISKLRTTTGYQGEITEERNEDCAQCEGQKLLARVL